MINLGATHTLLSLLLALRTMLQLLGHIELFQLKITACTLPALLLQCRRHGQRPGQLSQAAIDDMLADIEASLLLVHTQRIIRRKGIHLKLQRRRTACIQGLQISGQQSPDAIDHLQAHEVQQIMPERVIPVTRSRCSCAMLLELIELGIEATAPATSQLYGTAEQLHATARLWEVQSQPAIEDNARDAHIGVDGKAKQQQRLCSRQTDAVHQIWLGGLQEGSAEAGKRRVGISGTVWSAILTDSRATDGAH